MGKDCKNCEWALVRLESGLFLCGLTSHVAAHGSRCMNTDELVLQRKADQRSERATRRVMREEEARRLNEVLETIDPNLMRRSKVKEEEIILSEEDLCAQLDALQHRSKRLD